MNALVIALVAPLLQDAAELMWSLKEGQEFACSWSLQHKVFDYEYKLDVTGSMTVTRAHASGAECILKVIRLNSTGPEPRSQPIRFENGVLATPDPDSPAGKLFLSELTQPVKLSIGQRGGYEAVASRMLEAVFKKGEETSILGAIRPDLFGARLPEKPVTPGSTWEVELYGPKHKTAKSPAIFKVPYKLESVKGEIATITLNSRQELEIKLNTSEKSNYDLWIESVTEFNVRAGICTKWNSRVTSKRAGTSEEAVWEVHFEMAEKK